MVFSKALQFQLNSPKSHRVTLIAPPPSPGGKEQESIIVKSTYLPTKQCMKNRKTQSFLLLSLFPFQYFLKKSKKSE